MSCNDRNQTSSGDESNTNLPDSLAFEGGYSDVNGINMYYEIYQPANQLGSSSTPLILIHGGGSAIQTSFGQVIPLLARNRKIIAVELQAHGRTGDRNADL